MTKALPPEAVLAARALRDCGVIRVRFDHPGMIALYDAGLADCSIVNDDENALDWRIAR